MKVLWNFRESLVIWSVWLTLITAGEILVKSQKPLEGTKVVFNCEIKDTEKEITWREVCNTSKKYFECSPPYSAGICNDNKPDPRYEFNIKQSRNGLVSSVTIRRFNNKIDKDLVCEHNDLCISYLNTTGDYRFQQIGPYKNGNSLVDPCPKNYSNGSFYVHEGGKRGHLYSSDEVVILNCSNTAVECFSSKRNVTKEINVDCGIPVMESPGDVEAIVGDDIQLVVNISGMTINMSNVKWYKLSHKDLEGEPTERELTSNFRVHRHMNKTIAMITIYDVQVIDSGEYKASITVKGGTVIPKTFKLTVKDNLSTALGFGAGIGVGICLGFLTGCAVIVGGWFVWRWRKSKG